MRVWLQAATLLGALLLVLSGCLSPPGTDGSGDDPVQTDPIWFDAVRHPDEAVELIQRLDTFDGVTLTEIGRSIEDRPIHTVTLGEGPFTFWVTGRLHGNEPTGMEAILLFLELLADPDATLPADAPAILHDVAEHRELLLERLRFVFVPVGNPDGAAAYTRGNANGIDLNRDFFAFSEQETRVIRDAYWSHRPDGCLDLHNIGPSDNDFEGYGPEGPLLDPPLETLMHADSWRAVHEIDAQGGHASGFNEDYRAPEPLQEHPWPEVYHPGTHDFFCTSRGAPGWTPEGSIPSGDNGATVPQFAWSSRLHAVTVATSAFGWAGVYHGEPPEVHKSEVTTDSTTTHVIEIPPAKEGGTALFQVTWRPMAGYADHNQQTVVLEVTGPDGETRSGRTPGPYQWTQNILLEEAPAGTYHMDVVSPLPVEQQTRAYVTNTSPLVEVERTNTGLQVQALDAPGPVTVTLTDVADAGAWDEAETTPSVASVHELEGAVHERAVATWRLELEPGTTLHINVTGLQDDDPGPWRFTATSGPRIQSGHDTEPRVARG